MLTQLFLSLGVWHWLALSVVLIIFELILLNSGFLLWIAIAAGIVGLITALFPGLAPLTQLLIFSVTALICGVMGQIYFGRKNTEGNTQLLNRRNEQYIGRQFILDKDMVNGIGHIRVDDTLWRVKGDNLPAGTNVKIIGAEGVFLLVSKVE